MINKNQRNGQNGRKNLQNSKRKDAYKLTNYTLTTTTKVKQ